MIGLGTPDGVVPTVVPDAAAAAAAIAADDGIACADFTSPPPDDEEETPDIAASGLGVTPRGEPASFFSSPSSILLPVGA